MTLTEQIMSELSADRPELRTVTVHSWTETWVCCTRGRISYRLKVRGDSVPSDLVLNLAGLPELRCTLDVPVRAHGYVGWAKMGDKQVARRVVGMVNSVLEGVGV